MNACFVCGLLCDAVWCVLAFVVFVCDVLKHVWFDCDILCDGVWSVVCVGVCCVRELFVLVCVFV